MNINSVGSALPPSLPPSPASTANREGYAVNDRSAVASKNNRLATAPLDEAIDAKSQGEYQPVDQKQLDSAVSRIREFIQPINDSLQFSLDEDSGRTIVKVIDLKTDEVIRQIPSEEALNIAKALDKLQGLLFQAKA